MPTKRSLQDRVDQLQKELDRVARERDTARAESAEGSVRDSVEPGSLTRTEARDLMERVEMAETQRSKQLADLESLAPRLC